jgi:phage terminase small subunit
MNRRLTQKQENFCLAYIECGNASEAYRRAYDAENMQPQTIHVKASELLSSGKIGGKAGCAAQ